MKGHRIIDSFTLLEPGAGSVDAPMPREALRDEESLAAWPSTDITGYLFGSDPARDERKAIVKDLDRWLANLDQWGIASAQVPVVSGADDAVYELLGSHPDRIHLSVRVDPHEGMRGLNRVRDLARRYPSIRSISLSPQLIYPLIPLNAKEFYPVYTRAVDLDLAVYVNVGFPGARVPAFVQDPLALDEVCWFFPDLRVVMRHGGDPWVDVCIRMMQRWPNLYYATSGYTPRAYPKPILEFANRRGGDRIIFAGYFPTLSYEKIFAELERLPLNDDVWPRFLAGNAERAFKL
jgi:predicted TIM-barrel fold metal-dependent hydrolase